MFVVVCGGFCVIRVFGCFILDLVRVVFVCVGVASLFDVSGW